MTDIECQTAGNVIGFVSALIAAGLYGNIGVKVLYNNIFVDFLNAPPLTTKQGKVCRAPESESQHVALLLTTFRFSGLQ